MKQIIVNDKRLIYYSKQKLIRINKQDNRINYKRTKNAMRILTPVAIEMYLYFCMIENKSIWVLSSQYIYEYTLLTERTYTRAIKELIKHKFLVPSKIITDNGEIISNNVYDFFDKPS